MVVNMDRRIQIGSFTTAKDSSGEEIRTWSYASAIWAAYQPAGGREGFASNQKVGELDAIFIIRFRTGISQLNCILYNSKYYDIVAIEELERKNYLRLTAKIKDNEPTAEK